MKTKNNRPLVTPLMMALVVLLVPAVRGEDGLVVEKGSRVRAHVVNGPLGERAKGSETITGRLLGISETTITINEGGERAPLVLPRQRVTKLELSLRRSRRGNGALIGFGAGVAAAVLVGLASGSDENCSGVCFDAGQIAAMYSLLWGPAGAAIGAALAPGERWQTIAPDRIRPGLAGVPRARAAVAFTLRF